MPVTVAWLDASAGVAGDMLLGALVDAGVPLPLLQQSVDAVAPGAVRLTCETVRRAGMRATKVGVDLLADDRALQRWVDIRARLEGAGLPSGVLQRALAVFGRLAEAEARVHGIPADEVHFHEVGAWDSIADVVGVSAGLDHLGVARLTVSRVSLGTGRVRASHGDLPVPVPAVLELARGWEVCSGGEGELATPTGMAVVAALGQGSEALPDLLLGAVGVGAGTKDPVERPNVVRLVVGERRQWGGSGPQAGFMVVLEANVDDLDPRVWPSVLAALLEAGAADAWLVPILMKKGRPAHTLSVLATAERVDDLRQLILAQTSTIGVRESQVLRHALDRSWVTVSAFGIDIRVKVATRDTAVVHATPEFDDVAGAAARLGIPVRRVLEEATAALVAARLVPTAPTASVVEAVEAASASEGGEDRRGPQPGAAI